jgi:hypothetical protein
MFEDKYRGEYVEIRDRKRLEYKENFTVIVCYCFKTDSFLAALIYLNSI